MAILRHELWRDSSDGQWTFCLAGPMGDGARGMLEQPAELVWTVDAGSHYEAMTRYFEHQGWGVYTTDEPWDRIPYPDEWAFVQRNAGACGDDAASV